jgi:hypothetical protein
LVSIPHDAPPLLVGGIIADLILLLKMRLF